MLIHQYDSQTGQYLSSSLADEDPRRLGRWLIPAFSTVDTLPERQSLTWPFYRDGAWTLLPDYRCRVLYRCDNGEPTEILVPGTTPDENGLTDTPRPSDQYRWQDGAWVLDPDKIAQAKQAAAMAEFDSRMTKAKQKNAGRADAYAAGLLNDEQIYNFKAWSTYQMDLVRALDQDVFPEAVEWPAEPSPYVPPPPAEPALETAREKSAQLTPYAESIAQEPAPTA